MKCNLGAAAAAAAATVIAFTVPAARADSISSIESARANERAGRYLSRQDIEKLRRYGGNDDYGWRRGYPDYDYDGFGSPVLGVYIAPGSYYGFYGF